MPKHCLASTDELPTALDCTCSSARCGPFTADKRTDFYWGRNWEGVKKPLPFLTCQECRTANQLASAKRAAKKEASRLAKLEELEAERLRLEFQLAQSAISVEAAVLAQKKKDDERRIRLEEEVASFSLSLPFASFPS